LGGSSGRSFSEVILGGHFVWEVILGDRFGRSFWEAKKK
jgi:hypothetical protein